MASILLSIKPEYVERIFAGSKKYEFRKRLANKPVEKFLYTDGTDNAGRRRGPDHRNNIRFLRPLCGSVPKFAGISRDKYREYFKGCKTAYAYRLGDVTRYEAPKKLSEFNINLPPQSFIYLSCEQSDDELPNEIL